MLTKPGIKTTLLIIMAILSGCRPKVDADLIIRNAKIYTVDKNFTVVQNAVIKDGRFVAVGTDNETYARYKSNNILNLKGMYMYPGIIDNYCNFVEFTDSLLTASQGQLTYTQACKIAQKHIFASGITSIGNPNLNHVQVKTIDSIQKAGTLKLRIYAMLEPTAQNYNSFIINGHYITNNLTVRAISINPSNFKYLSKTTINNFNTNCNKTYIYNNTENTFDNWLQIAYNYKYQVCTQYICDTLNHLVLNYYSNILPQNNNYRWRIEQAKATNKNILKLYSEHNIIPVIKPTQNNNNELFWNTGLQNLLKQNNWLAIGSNFPANTNNSIQNYHNSLTPDKIKGQNKKNAKQQQKLSRVQALKAMTIWAARAQFDENNKGSIETGKLADFFITNYDIVTTKPDSITKTKILQTYVNGQKVFDLNNNQ